MAISTVLQSGTSAVVFGTMLLFGTAVMAHTSPHDFFSTGDLGFNGIKRWLHMGLPEPFSNPVPTDTWGVMEKNLAGYLSGANW